MLNGGLLPSDYYALAEQRVREAEPDPFYLGQHHETTNDANAKLSPYDGGGTALAEIPPKARIVGEVDDAWLYALKRRTVTVRHETNDRIVALLEIASPGDKNGPLSVQCFADEAVAAIQSGYHLVVIDMFPPRDSDPAGLASAVWEQIGGQRLAWPADKPLSAASFRVVDRVGCYAEAFAPGEAVPEMPLFYDPDGYVTLPLEQTYAAAYEGVPRRWRRVIEGGG